MNTLDIGKNGRNSQAEGGQAAAQKPEEAPTETSRTKGEARLQAGGYQAAFITIPC